jgi:hypothetical protein
MLACYVNVSVLFLDGFVRYSQTWDLNMNTKMMTLYFTDTVNASFSPTGFSIQNVFNLTNISLTSQAQSFLTYSFTTKHRVVVRDSLSTTFSALIGDRDINELKYLGLAASSSNTYLTAVYGETRSTFAGTIVPYLQTKAITANAALQVRYYTADTTPPSMLSFDLNLNDPAYLVVDFDEPVVPTSLNLGGLILISKAFGNIAVVTSGVVSSRNLTSLLINFTSTAVLNNIKISYSEGPLDGLMLGVGGARDMVGNQFVGIFEYSAVGIRSFIPDTTPPRITGITLALGVGTLLIEFSEVIDLASCLPYHITIMSNGTTNSSDFTLTLSNYSVILEPTVSSILVNMDLYSVDEIRLEFGLFVQSGFLNTTNVSYVLITGVQDLFGNAIVPVGQQITTVLPDTVQPILWSFSSHSSSTHKNVYNIVLYFSEVMKLSSFNCSDFVFASSASSSASEIVHLPDTDCFNETLVDNRISFSINHTTLYTTEVFISPSTTYIAYPISKGVVDYAGNELVNFALSAAKRQGTAVVKYMVDMVKGKVTLVFSSPVVRTGFVNITEFGFYSTVSKLSFFYNTTSVVGPLFASSPVNDTFMVIKFSKLDFIDFKYLDVAQSSLYLIVSATALRDVDNLWLLPISTSEQLTPIAFVPDTVKPTIQELSLDMSNDVLTLTFDEPIRSSSVVITNFRIQANQTSLANSIRLTGGTVVVKKNVVQLYFSRADMMNIKLRSVYGLATSNATSYLSFTFNSLTDYAGNAIRAAPFNNALQITDYITDTKSPTLLYYAIDFTTLLITFYFSEPVVEHSVNLTHVTLQNAFYSGNGKFYTLRGGTVLGNNSDVIVARMLLSDVNNIKLIAGLGRSIQLTYFTVGSGLCTDMYGNAFTAIPDGAAQAATYFTPDLIPPTVLAYTYDANDYLITLNMSEPVPLSSVNAAGLTISVAPGQHSSINYVNYTLSMFSLPSHLGSISFTVFLNIYPQDMNSLNALSPLASSINTTWASFTSIFLADTFGNPVFPVFPAEAMQPLKYIGDVTRPRIINYELDMNLMNILLTFSEAISLQSLDISQLFIQDCAVRRFCASINMSNAAAVFTNENAVALMTVTIPFDAMLFMKRNGIGLTLASSLLSWTDVFAADFAGNYMNPLWDGSVLSFTPREPDTLVPDTTAPTLLNWFLDRTRWNLHLRFSEPISVRNLTKVSIMVHTGHNTHTQVIFNSSVVVQYLNFNSEINLTFVTPSCAAAINGDDAQLCFQSSELQFLMAYASLDLFLFIDSGAVYDLAALPNPSASTVVQVLEGSPGLCLLCRLNVLPGDD